MVFHAGTVYEDGAFKTNGGRVLGVTATGKTLDDAIKEAYRYVDMITFQDVHYRTDIGIKKNQ